MNTISKIKEIFMVIILIFLEPALVQAEELLSCNELKVKASQALNLTHLHDTELGNSFFKYDNNQDIDVVCGLPIPFVNLTWKNGIPRNEFYETASRLMAILGVSSHNLNVKTAKFCIQYGAKKNINITIIYKNLHFDCSTSKGNMENTILTISNMSEDEKANLGTDTKIIPEAPWLREVKYINEE